jgi:hypothetical protein
MRDGIRGARAGLAASVLLLGIASPDLTAHQPTAPPPMPKRLRIALVPLDDRPVCLQYPRMLAGLAHAEVVTPPVDLLGRFTRPGDADAIARWLRTQDWSTVDALIVSIDMLAYGGLVASRVHGVDAATALARLDVVRDLHAAHPGLPIYGSSVIMRLAPTAHEANQAWRDALARYAELSSGLATDAPAGRPDPGAPMTPLEARELDALRRAIPNAALRDYERARTRNRHVNLAAVSLVADGVLRYLVVSQDDARPRGLHLQDRAAVMERVRVERLDGRVGVQPGADEVSMLLLSRAVLAARGLAPSVQAVFSSEQAREMVAPYEDRQLHETVRFQLQAAGATSAGARLADVDLDLFVFASRHDAGAGAEFASRVTSAIARGRRLIVADVDPKGDVQGASPALAEPLLAAGAFPRLYGYSSWNTAGNTVGTALAHGLLAWAGATMTTRCTSPAWGALADARATFMLHRLLNDYEYQGVLRPRLNASLRAASRTPEWLRAHAPAVAAGIRDDLAPRLASFASAFSAGAWEPPAPRPTDVAVRISAPRDLAVKLPWDRTFEADITFDLPTASLSGPARRLPSCAAAPTR